jgi:fluoride exporter
VTWLLVAIAGGLGAASRFLLDRALSDRLAHRLPIGTFVVNVSGSFAAGVVVGLLARELVPGPLGTVVAGGFLGAYTTFSTAMYETVRLLEEGGRLAAVANLLLTAVAALLAAVVGMSLVLA